MAGVLTGLYEAAARFENAARRRLLTETPLGNGRRRALEARALGRTGRATFGRRLGTELEDLELQGVARLPRSAILGLLETAERSQLEGLAARTPGLLASDSKLEGDALVAAAPEVFRLGLAPALLDLAEAYLAAPSLYLGATLKAERADGDRHGPRAWHRDVEDERLFRILVYLCDVDERAGPFEYIPAPLSEPAAAVERYRSGYLPDERMSALVDRGHWRAAHGRCGDAILFDGARVFHRARPPRTADRHSLTLMYVSRSPLELRLSTRLSRERRAAAVAGLTLRQIDCLPPARLI